MPEGHTLHRAAAEIRAKLGGQRIRTSSPQGRFAAGAASIDGMVVTGATAHGKHLFVHLADGRSIHVHLGIYGGFSWFRNPAADPVGAVRLRVQTQDWTVDLRGPSTCDVLDQAGVEAVQGRLGADPLRADPDGSEAARAGARLRRSRASVAGLLMDQTVVSGVGNVYRAELLFRHRLHPHAPGTYVTPRLWAAMWADLVDLMRAGYRTGRIDTVRPEHEPEAMGRPPRVDDHGGEVYVYRRHGQRCHVCGARVRTEVLLGRNLFWCPGCQRRGRPRAE